MNAPVLASTFKDHRASLLAELGHYIRRPATVVETDGILPVMLPSWDLVLTRDANTEEHPVLTYAAHTPSGTIYTGESLAFLRMTLPWTLQVLSQRFTGALVSVEKPSRMDVIRHTTRPAEGVAVPGLWRCTERLTDRKVRHTFVRLKVSRRPCKGRNPWSIYASDARGSGPLSVWEGRWTAISVRAVLPGDLTLPPEPLTPTQPSL